jgi:hypothetical protein
MQVNFDVISPRLVLRKEPDNISADSLLWLARYSRAFVATPPGIQLHVVSVLQKYIINLFLEKPLATSSGDLAFYENLSTDIGVVHVNHLEIHHPAIKSALFELRGNPLYLSCQIGAPYPARSDMSPLLEYAPHMVSLILTAYADSDLELGKVCMVPSFRPYSVTDGSANYHLQFLTKKRPVASLLCGNGFLRKTRLAVFFDNERDVIYEDRAAPMLRQRQRGSLDESPLNFDYEPPLTASIKSFLAKCAVGNPNRESLDHAIKVNELLLTAQRRLGHG